MTDLFANTPAPKRNVGYGNAMFLCDLAEGVPDATMRAKFKAGEYPHLTTFTQDYRVMFGRKPKESTR